MPVKSRDITRYARGIPMKEIVVAIALSLLPVSCANLKEVRDYANEAAKFSAYTELTTRFRDTYEREKPYLTGEADSIAKENDKKRKEFYKTFLAVHEHLALYMKTLAVLAGDEAFDMNKEIDTLAKRINKFPELGFDGKHVEACADILKIIAKWAASGMQQHEVRKMVAEGNGPLQTAIEGMNAVLRQYRFTHDNERKEVLGLFEMQIAFTDDSKDRLLQTLARVQRQAKEAEFKMIDVKFDAAERGLRSIAAGHEELVKNANDLSAKEARDIIDRIVKDIKAVRADLEAASL